MARDPLRVAAERRRVSGAWIRQIARVNDARAVERALRAAGLARPWLDGDARPAISLRQEVDFFEAMAREVGDPLFGLRSAAGWAARGTTLGSLLGFAAPRLADGLALFVRFARVDRDFAEPALVRAEGRRVALVFDPIDPYERLHPQARDFRNLAALRVLDAVLDRPLPMRAVELLRTPPAEPSDAARLFDEAFRAPVRFEADRTAFVFDAEALDWPVPTQNDELAFHLRSHAETLLAERAAQKPEISRLIERRILDALPVGGVSMKALARELGLSQRTLSRRMRASGTSLRGVTESLRRELAEAHLADRRLSVGEIALLLGYADVAAFSAAYKRWTGRAPSLGRAAPS